MKIGLGESTRFLRHHQGWLSRLLSRQFKPDRLVAELAPFIVEPGLERGRPPPLHLQRGGAHRTLAP